MHIKILRYVIKNEHILMLTHTHIEVNYKLTVKITLLTVFILAIDRLDGAKRHSIEYIGKNFSMSLK